MCMLGLRGTRKLVHVYFLGTVEVKNIFGKNHFLGKALAISLFQTAAAPHTQNSNYHIALSNIRYRLTLIDFEEKHSARLRSENK